MLLGAVAAGGSTPFWMNTNQYGLMPEDSGMQLYVQTGMQFDTTKTFQWHWAFSGAANTEKFSNFKVIPDEIYAGFRWKVVNFDLGMKRQPTDFMAVSPYLGSLSTTSGHLVWSGNARTMPGYTITIDPLKIFKSGWLWFYGAFGDYVTLDNRYMSRALVHSQKLFLRFDFLKRFSFHVGLDHYAIWGGSSAAGKSMNVNLSNYIRMCLGMSADASGTLSDQMNVIGDHGGAELLRLDYRGDGWKISAQHEIPYSDKSGMEFYNFPDGVNTLSFSFDDPNKWVSGIVYEFQYTMNQSGSRHDAEKDWDPTKYFKGRDNYFNNGEYKSGWTYYGRTIGNPLFLPVGTKAGTWSSSDIVLGIENNLVKAHHVGLTGKLFHKAPYRLMLTWSRNYGIMNKLYAGGSLPKDRFVTADKPYHQVCGAFQAEYPLKRGLNITAGVYADRGQVLADTFGATVGVRWDIVGSRF